MAEQKSLNSNPQLNRLLNDIVESVNHYAEVQLAHIRSLTQIGIALSSESDINKIFDLILEEALTYTNADGATIYSVSDDKRFLDFQIVYNRTMKLRMGGAYGPISWPSIPLYQEDGSKQMRNLATYVAHTGTLQIIEDVYDQTIFDNSGTRKVDQQNKYRSKSMIAIPLKDHEDEVLGVVQLINAMNPEGEVVGFTNEHMAMLTSLASIAAIILTNKKLVVGLETLLHQFIRANANAIDRKSPYSGGHITRVASLTEALAEHIQKCEVGAFADIEFTDDEMEEIALSGWMHDLGKIVTPVYIMDKATKLETIFDRIELVRTRFELMQAVIERDILRLEQGGKDAARQRELVEQLGRDLAFIEVSNIGGEFMKDEDMAALDRIGKCIYKSEGKSYFLLSDDEVKNLSIRRGTLLPEEFAIMQEHATITAEMLDQLTFPKKYRHVPLYASSHHEKLNGKGYPNQLSGDEMPLQARIIAIADLFEALTAADRPYKKWKTLTESLRIMGFCAKDGEIDKDILNLFIDSGLYLKYANEYLKPKQIDDVDTDKIKSMYNPSE
ncbi:MAG: GAF domain-containing protein [Candidatus Cloacimonetes bacterium]|nr:GAF domain-containing protein [Candidatus Cloacimonadota bacterium]